MKSILPILFLAFLAPTSLGHPGHTHDEIAAEARERAKFLSSLDHADASHCHAELEAGGHALKLSRRRAEKVDALRRERDLQNRRSWVGMKIRMKH
jgi:hypothetical protein